MPSDPRTLVRLVLALVLLVVPPWCLWQALELVFTLFGESPTAAEQQAADRWVTTAVVVALAASVLGLLLSTGRRGAVLGFGTALALSCGLALLDASTGPQAAPAPQQPSGGGACQEHSGGPTTCPGG